MSLKNKVVIVTGSSKGIGYEIAKEFAENRNSQVVICSRNFEQSNSASISIKGSTTPLELDVANDESVNIFVENIRSKFSRVDILINNAGYPYDSILWNKKPHEVTISEFNRVISVDLFGAFRVSRAIIPLMLRNKNYRYPKKQNNININQENNLQEAKSSLNGLAKGTSEREKFQAGGGVIISISSTPAISGQPGGFPYSVAKAGNIALTKCLAKEYGQFNIRAYSLALGNISTKATIDSLPESMIIKAAKESPMNRWGEPIEVARVAAAIASEEFSFANGNTIIIDGGTVMI